MEKLITPEMRTLRTIPTAFETREEDGAMHISGYFAVFNSNYEMGDQM